MISRKKIDQLAESAVRLKSLPYEHRTDAVQKLFVYVATMGIEQVKTKLETEVVVNFLLNQFGYLNINEVLFALELYSGEKINIAKEKHHYGKLTTIFLGAVLSEYEKLKRETRMAQPESAPVERQLTGKDELQQWKDEYLFMLNWIKEGGVIPQAGNFAPCFNYLKSIGEIKLNKDQYDEHIARVKELIHLEADGIGIPEKRRTFLSIYAFDGIVFKNKCREQYFKDWIQDKLINNSDSEGKFDNWITTEINKIK